jgi:hypothetical protein
MVAVRKDLAASEIDIRPLDEIGKPMRPLSDDPAWMIDFLGRIPKDIKLDIRGRTMVAGLKFGYPRIHDLLGHVQRRIGVQGISTRPKIRPDLVTGDFTMGPNGLVVITAFEHGQR